MVQGGDEDGWTRRRDPCAFEVWLRRDLKERFGDVAREQVPPDLIELIERGPTH